MAYSADPDDASAPQLSTLAGTAQDDLVKLKQKLNNFFLASGYYAPLLQQSLKAGTVLTLNLPAGTDSGILYGHAVNITRNDAAAAAGTYYQVTAVAAQLTAIQGDNVNAPTSYVFGCATEAWTSKVNSQAILIGLESSVISQFNANTCAIVGFDVVFKNRPDSLVSPAGLPTVAGNFIWSPANQARTYIIKTLGTTDFTLIGAASNTVGVVFTATGPGSGTGTAALSVVQGLGANQYNRNSRAIQVTAQASSGSGEFCGWHRGITFENNSLSQALVNGVVVPAIGLDFTNMGNPANLGSYNNPWVAYSHSSMIALSEYMSITWDKLQFVRSYLDSLSAIPTLWLVSLGGNSTTPTNPTNVFGWDYGVNNCMVMNVATAGAPSAAIGSFKMLINGVIRNIAYSA